MNARPSHARNATVMFEPRGQTSERVHAVIDEILKASGCPGCWQVAIFRVDLISNPAPDFAKNGATSVDLHGF